ncbi:hypothetical protein [Kribbella sp. NPDC023855]|uniref:sunset domain-containing protein n=1 Tax=Kribbella sp. NPDC023855 TaxID=3154698 RepID=UPI003410D819
MAWLFRHNWPWSLLAFAAGAIITWLLLNRRDQSPAAVPAEQEEPAEEKTLVAAGVATAGTTTAPPSRRFEEPIDPFDQTADEPPQPKPAPKPEPEQEPEPERAPEPQPEPAAVNPVFSQRMDAGEPTLFDDTAPADEVQVKSAAVPVGRYGEGSADAVAHQGPPDGFTIKGNAQSMLFHTPDSPYYGRTKPEVWFRTEADAERAGFTKYTRKPRKSPRPTD